jgi:hypothetical protein
MQDKELNAFLKKEMVASLASPFSSIQEDKPQRGVLEHKIITGFTLRSYPNGLLVKVSGSEWIKIDNNPTLYKKKKSEPVKQIPVSELKPEEVY